MLVHTCECPAHTSTYAGIIAYRYTEWESAVHIWNGPENSLRGEVISLPGEYTDWPEETQGEEQRMSVQSSGQGTQITQVLLNKLLVIQKCYAIIK